MSKTVRFNHVGPQFSVDDVAAAVTFYSDVLGFGVDYLLGEPPSYAVVFRDDVYIHLAAHGQRGFGLGSGSAFVAVSGVDEIWNQVESMAPDAVVEPLEDRDFGLGVSFRVFSLADPAGNTLRIGQPRTRNT